MRSDDSVRNHASWRFRARPRRGQTIKIRDQSYSGIGRTSRGRTSRRRDGRRGVNAKLGSAAQARVPFRDDKGQPAEAVSSRRWANREGRVIAGTFLSNSARGIRLGEAEQGCSSSRGADGAVRSRDTIRVRLRPNLRAGAHAGRKGRKRRSQWATMGPNSEYGARVGTLPRSAEGAEAGVQCGRAIPTLGKIERAAGNGLLRQNPTLSTSRYRQRWLASCAKRRSASLQKCRGGDPLGEPEDIDPLK